MKRVTATEARRDWFRILDEVAAGEVVVVDRGGVAIQLRREPREDRVREVPDYTGLIRAAEDARDAERWGWAWSEDAGDLRLVEGGEEPVTETEA